MIKILSDKTRRLVVRRCMNKWYSMILKSLPSLVFTEGENPRGDVAHKRQGGFPEERNS
jgi:hypothetical protein